MLTAIPCHHIYGFLFTLVLPARLHIPVLDLRGRFPAALAAALRPGDLVIGHPGFWADLARAAPDGWPRDIVGVTSGAPCPDDVAGLASQAGLSRLLQVYGATETGGVGWRDAPGAPYRLLPYWRRSADGTSVSRAGGTPVAAPDHLRWHGPDRFIPEGRQDQAVQVGGINVQPAHVRTVLRAHPAVADAVVRLMAAAEGSRLKAYIVPSDPGAAPAALREQLALHVAEHLSPTERPRAYSFGPALPHTSAGKPADWPLG